MCAICGIGFMKDHSLRTPQVIKEIISNLLIECQKGGRQATGVSIMTEKEAHVLRRPVNGTHFVSLPEYADFLRETIQFKKGQEILSVIGHCRFPTKGDPSNHFNNHPIVCDRIVGVHNGCIGNDDELFAEHGMKRIAEVDTEIIFSLINHHKTLGKSTHEAVVATTNQIQGSYACAMQDLSNPYALYLFRAFGPTDIKYFPSLGVVFFATSQTFIENSVRFANLGVSNSVNYPNDTGIIFDLFKKKISRYEIKVENDTPMLSPKQKRRAGFITGGNHHHVWPD